MSLCRFKTDTCCVQVATEVRKPKSCAAACGEKRDPTTGEPLVPILTGEYEGKGGGSYQLCAVFEGDGIEQTTGFRSGFMLPTQYPGDGCTYGYGNAAKEASKYDCYCMTSACTVDGDKAPLQLITVEQSNNGTYNCHKQCESHALKLPMPANGSALALNDAAQVCATNEGGLGFRPATTWPEFHSGKCIAVDEEKKDEILTQTEDWKCLCTFEINKFQTTIPPPSNDSVPVNLPPTASPSTSSSSNDGLSRGAIAGIIVGAVVLLGLVVLILVVRKRKLKRQHGSTEPAENVSRGRAEKLDELEAEQVSYSNALDVPPAAAQPIYSAEVIHVHEGLVSPTGAVPVPSHGSVITASSLLASGVRVSASSNDARQPPETNKKEAMRRHGVLETDSDDEDLKVETSL